MIATSSLVTRQDDPQWSSVVHWIVMATFYAEENGISFQSSYDMPLVNLLGQYPESEEIAVDGSSSSDNSVGFPRLLRDAVLVGNYGELYERNVERFIKRSGRNKLNQNPFGPQLNPFLLF